MKSLWIEILGGRSGDGAKRGARQTSVPIADKFREPAFFVLCIFAFLDAILRSSPSSDVTAFRIGIVIYILVFSAQLIRSPRALLAIAMMIFAAFYMFVQALFYGYLNESIVMIYAVLILTMMAFVFLVADYASNFGVRRLLVFLEAWYVVILLLSFIQLAFSIEFPNAPYRDGVARIYFGQENDASVAIAAFLPLLALLSRPRIHRALLFIGGTAVIYVNGTRMVLLAVAFLLCAMLADCSVSWLGKRFGIRRSLIWIPAALATLAVVFVFRDVPIPFADHAASLSELILVPIQEVLAGKAPDELTSVNIRVTLVIAAIQELVMSNGFGIGVGATPFLVSQYYPPSLVTSIHVFPLQMLVEMGWLFVLIVVVLCVLLFNSFKENGFFYSILFMILIVSSSTSGVITNYFYFCCFTAICIVFTSQKSSSELSNPSSGESGTNGSGVRHLTGAS